MAKMSMTEYEKMRKGQGRSKLLANSRKQSRERLNEMQKRLCEIVQEFDYELEALIVKDKKTGAISKIG